MIRGTKREMAETPTKRFDVGASIHNRFDIEVVDAVSGKVKRKAYAENVICDALWTRMFAGNAYNTGIHYGDGTGTPSAGDTSLFSFIGYVASSVHDVRYDYDNNVYSVTKKAVILETEAVGRTITEIGIAYGSTATYLATHAMLRDMNGNPVSLLKTDTDIFNVYATVFVHLSMPAGARCLGTTVGGSSAKSESFYKPSNYYKGYLSHIAGLVGKPSSPQSFFSGGHCVYKSDINPTISYDSVKRSMIIECPRAAASSQNAFRGIKNIYLGTQPLSNYATFTLDFIFEVDEGNSWYSGTKVAGEAIGTGDGATRDFATKFNFANNAIIRVDGVPVEATVDFGCARNIAHYFRLLRLPATCSYTYDSSHRPDLPMYTPNDADVYFHYNDSGDMALRPVYENALHATHGIASISGQYKYIAVSDDLVNWVVLANNVNGATAIPEQYQHFRYWIMHATHNASDGYKWTFTPTEPVPTATNIHLAEAPPEGAVITADYDAICVGKDENHVFDFSVTFQFNEYTET